MGGYGGHQRPGGAYRNKHEHHRFAVIFSPPYYLASSLTLTSSLCLLRVALCLPRVALLASASSPCPSLCVGGVGFLLLPTEPNEVAWAAPGGVGFFT